MADINVAVKNRSTTLSATTILSLDTDWAGDIVYYTEVKNTSVATLTITFAWTDRSGNAAQHQVTGLSLLGLGPLAGGTGRFNAWTRAANPSNMTLTLTVVGIIGSGSFDFFANGRGVSYGA
jgi:hypothetical protein